MKLYTEEQIREAYNQGRTDWINEIENDNILSNITPIELPSDEDIDKKFTASPDTDMYRVYDNGIKYGVKWLKQQILKQNK